MKTKHTLIALAVSALVAAPAFAGAPGDSQPPCFSCKAADASVNDSQKIEYLDVNNDKVTNKATVKDQFMEHASGNIGVNEAAGYGNQQANAAAIADAKFCFIGAADASIDAHQSSKHNDMDNNGTTNIATLKDNAMKYVSGNVGLNMAAGDANQQKNDLAVASVTGGTVASASTDAYQRSHGNDIDNDRYHCTNTTNTAKLEGNAMQWASGNIGVNMAAGSGNQQFNGLSVASAK